MPRTDDPRDPSHIIHSEEFAAIIQQALDLTTTAFAKVPSRKHTALLKTIVGGSDVCIGVFQDPNSPKGWDHMIIKGTKVLVQITESGLPKNVKLTAISCREAEEAVAMRMVFGEKDGMDQMKGE